MQKNEYILEDVRQMIHRLNEYGTLNHSSDGFARRNNFGYFKEIEQCSSALLFNEY